MTPIKYTVTMGKTALERQAASTPTTNDVVDGVLRGQLEDRLKHFATPKHRYWKAGCFGEWDSECVKFCFLYTIVGFLIVTGVFCAVFKEESRPYLMTMVAGLAGSIMPVKWFKGLYKNKLPKLDAHEIAGSLSDIITHFTPHPTPQPSPTPSGVLRTVEDHIHPHIVNRETRSKDGQGKAYA